MGVLEIEGIEREVVAGRGAFGVVYRAWQRGLEREVAVKVLVGAFDEAALRRFERECAAVGSLSQEPGILTVYAMGRTRGGSPYLVMPFVDGGSLADRLRAGPMAADEVLRCGVAVGRALSAAHRGGVLHLDVKPANVLVDARGGVQLVDFGIARFIDGEHGGHTATVAGTPGYAGPEIFDGREPSVASDVYGLGATLHAMAGGRPPFSVSDAGGLSGLLRQIATQPPPDLRPLGVPPALCAEIDRAMAKEPADRFPSVAAMVEALEAVGVDMGVTFEQAPVAGGVRRAAPTAEGTGLVPNAEPRDAEHDVASTTSITNVEDAPRRRKGAVVEDEDPATVTEAGSSRKKQAVSEPAAPPSGFGLADMVRFGLVMAVVAGLIVAVTRSLGGDDSDFVVASFAPSSRAGVSQLEELHNVSQERLVELGKVADPEKAVVCQAVLDELESGDASLAAGVLQEAEDEPGDRQQTLTNLRNAWLRFWRNCSESWDRDVIEQRLGEVEQALDEVNALGSTDDVNDGPSG